MASELRLTTRAASEGWVQGRVQGMDLGLDGHEDRVDQILTTHWRRVFEVFGARVFDAGKSISVGHETKDDESEFTRRVTRWIETFGASKVQRISATTRRNIVDAVLAGEEAGEGVPVIARRIRETGSGVIGAARSLVIARTETHSASTAAGDEALSVLNIPEVRREWVAAEDGRTRETHRTADGQIRGQNEHFDVGGFKLMRPGDPSGPAREVIACRCIAAAVIED